MSGSSDATLTALCAAELAQVRAELARAEDRYRALAEGLPHYIYRIDRQGRLTFANAAFLALYHAKLEDILGKTSWEFFPSKMAAKYAADDERVMAQDQRFVAIEPNINPATGRREYVEVTKTPLHDVDGQVIGLQGMFWCVTERVLAEEALCDTEGWLRLIVEHAPFGVSVVDRQGQTLFAAAQAQPACGALLDTLDSDERQAMEQALLEVFEHKRPTTVVTHAVDSSRVFQHRLAPIERDGAVRSAVLFTADITKERELEARLLQSSRIESLGRLAGGVAHDFNNLLTAILCCGELLREGDANGQLELADEIVLAAKKSRDLTRQLLAFSRRQVIVPRTVALTPLVGEMRALLQRLLPENIELVLDIRQPQAVVIADRGQLEQVLVNLVVNAKDAMPLGGTITIGLHAYHVAHPTNELAVGDYYDLSVTDTGTGIAPEVLSHIFEPFYTTKEAGRGTGLGLSLVYGSIRQCSGVVRVDTELGVGSSFHVLLPCASIRHEPSGVMPARVGPCAHFTVVVVEDEPSVAALVGRILSIHGYRVHIVGDPDALLARLRAQAEPVHLVLTDVGLPGRSGFALGHELASMGIAVLYMSGYIGSHLPPGLVAPELVLSKPFTPRELLERVAQSIGGQARPLRRVY